jgi:hypothetical protein
VAAELPFCKTKNPTAGLAMGFVNYGTQSEPDRRAAQQQQHIEQVQV